MSLFQEINPVVARKFFHHIIDYHTQVHMEPHKSHSHESLDKLKVLTGMKVEKQSEPLEKTIEVDNKDEQIAELYERLANVQQKLTELKKAEVKSQVNLDTFIPEQSINIETPNPFFHNAAKATQKPKPIHPHDLLPTQKTTIDFEQQVNPITPKQVIEEPDPLQHIPIPQPPQQVKQMPSVPKAPIPPQTIQSESTKEPQIEEIPVPKMPQVPITSPQTPDKFQTPPVLMESTKPNPIKQDSSLEPPLKVEEPLSEPQTIVPKMPYVEPVPQQNYRQSASANWDSPVSDPQPVLSQNEFSHYQNTGELPSLDKVAHSSIIDDFALPSNTQEAKVQLHVLEKKLEALQKDPDSDFQEMMGVEAKVEKLRAHLGNVL